MLNLCRQISAISGAGSESEGLRRRASRSRTVSVASSGRAETSKISRLDSTERDNGAQPGGALIQDEEEAVGSVKGRIYRDFVTAMGVLAVSVSMLFFAAICGFRIASQLWLSAWTEDSTNPALRNSTAQRDYRLGVFAAWGAAEMLATLVAVVSLDLAAIQGVRVIHEKMLYRVMRSPMSFFDTTPMGRILNRFVCPLINRCRRR